MEEKLTIYHKDGTTTEVEPIKPWSPCIGEGCIHLSHKIDDKDDKKVDRV